MDELGQLILGETAKGPKLDGLHPTLQTQIQAANNAYREQYGTDLPITSGARSREEQQSLYDRAARGEPNIFIPANPAKEPNRQSYHEGAVDISTNVPPEFAARMEKEFGLHRPYGAKDPVHWEVHPSFKPAENPQMANATTSDANPVAVSGQQTNAEPTLDNFILGDAQISAAQPTQAAPAAQPMAQAEPIEAPSAVAQSANRRLATPTAPVSESGIEQLPAKNLTPTQQAKGEETVASVAGNVDAILSMPAGLVKSLATAYMYLGERAMPGAFPLEKREEIANSIGSALTPELAKTIGIDPNSKGYQDALLQKVGQLFEKGIDYAAEKTGLPKSDLEAFVNLVPFATPKIPIKGAVESLKEQFAAKQPSAPRFEPTLEPRVTTPEAAAPLTPDQATQVIAAKNAGATPEALQTMVDQFNVKKAEAPATQLQQSFESKIEATKSIPVEVPQNVATVLGQKLGETPLLPEVAQQVKDAIKRGETINPDAVVLHNKARQFGIELTPGQKSLDPALISKEMNERGIKEAYVGRFNEQSNLLHEAADKIKTNVSPTLATKDYVGLGEVAIDRVNNLVEQNSKKTADAYKALNDANGGKFPINGKAIADDAIAKLTLEDRLDYLPPVIAKKLESYASGKKEMNFNLFENLRTDLAAEMRRADRAGEGTTKNALSVVRDSLEQLPLASGAEQFKGLADKARAAFKADKDLESTVNVYKDVKNGVADTKNFIDNVVFKGGNSEFVKSMKLLDSQPLAKEALASGALDMMIRKSTDASGNFKPAMFGKMVEDLDVNRRLEPLFGKEKAANIRDLAEVSAATVARPKGSFVNESNTTVAAMNLAKNVTGSMLTKVPVVGPLVGGVGVAAGLIKGFKAQMDVGRSLKPGAGISSKKIKLKDIGKE